MDNELKEKIALFIIIFTFADYQGSIDLHQLKLNLSKEYNIDAFKAKTAIKENKVTKNIMEFCNEFYAILLYTIRTEGGFHLLDYISTYLKNTSYYTPVTNHFKEYYEKLN